jgi:hypothetical protein
MDTEQPQSNSSAQTRPDPQNGGPSGNSGAQPATVLVRGETVVDQSGKAPPNNASSNTQKKPEPEKVSEAKVKLQNRLPALEDDADVGVQKEQIVVRDGKADLAFIGTLVASAAPTTAPEGHWDEYRVYETTAGKHVFSKITRKIQIKEHDEHKAEVFEPVPSTMTAQIVKSAHDLTHSRPKEWTDAAVDFFGYDPLAKALYRKLGDQFEEHVS